MQTISCGLFSSLLLLLLISYSRLLFAVVVAAAAAGVAAGAAAAACERFICREKPQQTPSTSKLNTNYVCVARRFYQKLSSLVRSCFGKIPFGIF